MGISPMLFQDVSVDEAEIRSKYEVGMLEKVRTHPLCDMGG